MKRQKIKSTNEFISILKILNPSVEVVGEYISSNNPILVKCKLCGELFKKKPSDLKNGMLHNCTKQKWVKPIYSKKQSELLLQKIHSIYWNNHNISISSLPDSVDNFKCKCNICGNEWEDNLESLSKKCFCEVCSSNYGFDNIGVYKENLLALFANSYGIRLLKKDGSILYCHCDVCNDDFEVNGYMKLKKIVCPNCKRQNKKRVKPGMSNIQRRCDKMKECILHNDYQCKECLVLTSKYYSVDEVFELIKKRNDNITIISEKPLMIDAKTEIECQCNICKYKYLTRPIFLINGLGRCKLCSMSKGEKKIRYYLEKRNISFIQEKTFDDLRYHSKLRFDFYLPKLKIAIEYDGLQHFKPTNFSGSNKSKYIKDYEEQVKRDKLKDLYCKKKKILLIRIKYNEDIDDRLDDILLCNVNKL